jgi:hypothetical protein
MLTRPKSILPFQNARDVARSFRAVDGRVSFFLRAILNLSLIRPDHVRLFAFLVVQVESRRGLTFTDCPRKSRSAGDP